MSYNIGPRLNELPHLSMKSSFRARILISHRTSQGILRGRLRTVDLLVLTSLDQLLFILKILLTSFTKQAAVLRLPPKLVFPGPEVNVIKRFPFVIYDYS
jgi:hypothetical protein